MTFYDFKYRQSEHVYGIRGDLPVHEPACHGVIGRSSSLINPRSALTDLAGSQLRAEVNDGGDGRITNTIITSMLRNTCPILRIIACP